MIPQLLSDRLVSGWRSLQPRERIIIAAGSIIALALICYTLLWMPMQRDLSRLRASVPKARSQLALMDVQARQIARMRASGSARRSTGNLLTRLERSAVERGIRQNITRMEPDGADAARLSFDAVNFNGLLSWLADLQRQDGVRTESATITAQPDAAIVNVRLLLRRPGT
ncbi:MAG: type II secretion system protein GspM [Acidiferrobacterales bacterium]